MDTTAAPDYFPMKLQIRLDWSEMDVFGHINNVMYLKFMQAARVNYWEQAGITTDWTALKIGPMLANTACQFIKPLFYPGHIEIETRVEFLKTTSFGLHHRIWNADRELVAEGHDVVVLYDFNQSSKYVIPDDLRQKIQTIEQRSF